MKTQGMFAKWIRKFFNALYKRQEKLRIVLYQFRELPATDRYTQAGADFVSGRRMNAETQSIFDNVSDIRMLPSTFLTSVF